MVLSVCSSSPGLTAGVSDVYVSGRPGDKLTDCDAGRVRSLGRVTLQFVRGKQWSVVDMVSLERDRFVVTTPSISREGPVHTIQTHLHHIRILTNEISNVPTPWSPWEAHSWHSLVINQEILTH